VTNSKIYKENCYLENMISNTNIRDTIGIKRFTPDDLKEKALIRTGTKVKMLEYDLANCPRFLFFGNKWEGLFKSWLRKGADIEVFLRNPSHDSIKLFEEFGKRVAFYDFSGINKDNIPEVPLDVLRNYHFTLFYSPKQLWTESNHLFGKGYMKGCDYHSKTNFASGREEAWEKDFGKLGRWIDSLKQRARRIKA